MIKIKKKGGHVIYQPLSATFQMQELGGSSQQKFDATTGTWKPNRILTPYLLRPQLLIQDPEGILPTGDYSSDLVETVWTVKSLLNNVVTNLVLGTDYTIDSATKALTLLYNVAVDEIVTITYKSHYVDPRRADTNALTFEWSTQVTTEAEADYKVTLDTGQWNSKILMSPFKNWGRFGIPVQLKDGDDAIADARCTYQWQWWTGTAWSEDFSERFWYVSGATSKQIQLDADFIQDITLRVKAIAYGDTTHPLYFATRLLRWYGQYQEDVDFLTGKYVFSDSTLVKLQGKVSKAAGGDITNPAQYFDMVLFFAVGNEELAPVAYGEEATIERDDLQDGEPRAGILVRERTCFLPIADAAGKILSDDTTILFAQIPTTSTEEE